MGLNEIEQWETNKHYLVARELKYAATIETLKPKLELEQKLHELKAQLMD